MSSSSRVLTLEFLKTVDDASCLEELEFVPRGWEDFDAALYNAIDSIAVGNLKRELDLYRERCFTASKPTVGRVALWMLFQRYILPRGFLLSQDMKLVSELKCRDDLEKFLLEYEVLQLRFEQKNISPGLWDYVLTTVKSQLEK